MTQAPPNTPIIFPSNHDVAILPLDIPGILFEATYSPVSQTIQNKADREQAYRHQCAKKEGCDNTELHSPKNN